MRSRIMAAVRGKDTGPERRMRSLLTALGLRYRLHRKDLPGKPDIVFPGARLVVFCDGDFWHGRDWAARLARTEFKTRAEFWKAKIETNIARDRKVDADLKERGWEVVRLWESEIKREGPALAARVFDLLRSRGDYTHGTSAARTEIDLKEPVGEGGTPPRRRPRKAG